MRAGGLMAVSSFMLAVLSCASSLEPRSNVTLLVTNGTCSPGPCSAQQVLGFPSNQPDVPSGDWSLLLGTMTGTQLCVTLPISATFTVSGSDGTTKYVWNTAKSVSLGVLAPSADRFEASPSTTEFVPATASGWSITLPGGTQAVPAAACTP